jgi:AcrR family transcriptional regulator
LTGLGRQGGDSLAGCRFLWYVLPTAMDTRARIIEAFSETLRETGHPPETVFGFCKRLDLPERDFFTEFASLHAVENAYWEQIIHRVILAVESGAEWAAFDARQRLLSFLYAFFEDALNHRSLLLARLAKLGPLARPDFLRGFESRFKAFAKAIVAHGVASGEIAERGRLSALYPEVLYLHLRGVIDFNLRDESRGYERTDAFIEKTVAVAFDLLRTQVFDSALDLARFLIPCREGSAA